MPRDYTITWVINVGAEDVDDAIRQVWGLMHDEDSTATYFTVQDQSGKVVAKNKDFYELIHGEPYE
jgi:hypothetical protein